jgi:hypothetical protein
MAPNNTNMEEKTSTKQMSELDYMPLTVVGHKEYESGYDLELLDDGSDNEPRFVRTFDDDRDMELIGI